MQENWKQLAKENKKKYETFLKRCNEREVIKKLPDLHEKAFSKIDCLSCANCCKNHSPRFKAPDIKRISKYLGLKETEFKEQFLFLDTENDFVNKSLPCPFLNEENECQIYDVRPSDCARYPYTNEDVFVKRKNLTLVNATVCPAVFSILENLTAEK